MNYYKEKHKGASKLLADCKSCFGLCCVALYFTSSEGFPIEKEAGQACPNLRSDFCCNIYHDLREMGLKGCTAFDCFGAGQKVSQASFSGRDWIKDPEAADKMFQVFQVMRQLHELLWYISQALTLKPTKILVDQLELILEQTESMTNLRPDHLIEINLAEHREAINTLLLKTSEYVRQKHQSDNNAIFKSKKTLGGRLDFIGADLRKSDLKGKNLRGAYLIAVDMRKVDLSGADLIGADLRDADIRGADLTGSIFVTQAQVNTAIGDSSTKLPQFLTHPPHWTT